MRLVGASTLYIALPFLLEALVTALIGVVLAAGALAAFMYFGDRAAAAATSSASSRGSGWDELRLARCWSSRSSGRCSPCFRHSC